MPSPTVAERLRASHVAHQQYRTYMPRGRAGLVIPGDPAEAKAQLQIALLEREAAHAADPGHTDPAWREEVQHDDLVAFYRQQLAKESV